MLRHPGTMRRRPEGRRELTYTRMKAAHYERLVEMYSKVFPAPESTLIDLTNLITRHEENLLSSSEYQESLRTSELHRARVAANVEHGRNLLFEVERSLQHIKNQARKDSILTDLESKRQQIQALRRSLHDLAVRAETHDGSADDEGVSSDNEEDALHTPQESTSGPSSPPSMTTKSPPLGESPETAHGVSNRDNVEPAQSGGADNATPITAATPTPSTAATENSQRDSPTLRKRMRSTTDSASTNDPTTAAATGTATSRAAPSQPTTTAPAPNAPDAKQPLASETALSEQENLTSSLVSLAAELKASSRSFQTTLESEKPILSRAVEGLDRNISGMDAAGQRMGFLRRMTEGKGWWGRILLYAWIFGLWIVVLLIMFLGPKLRF